MIYKTVSITHTNEGIRFYWPDSTSSVFSNPIYLAEAYSRSRGVVEKSTEIIKEEVTTKLNELDDELNKLDENEKAKSALADLRDKISSLAMWLNG